MNRFDERAQHHTPGSDRVRDGRHVMHQDDGCVVFRVLTIEWLSIREDDLSKCAVIERVGDAGV